jgi:hypothetical protein
MLLEEDNPRHGCLQELLGAEEFAARSDGRIY